MDRHAFGEHDRRFKTILKRFGDAVSIPSGCFRKRPFGQRKRVLDADAA